MKKLESFWLSQHGNALARTFLLLHDINFEGALLFQACKTDCMTVCGSITNAFLSLVFDGTAFQL